MTPLMPHIGSCWCHSWPLEAIKALEPFVGDTEHRLWNEGVQGGTIEWMSAMANRLPMMIVTRLIGVPDVDVEQLMRWGYASTQMVEGLVGQEELTAARSGRWSSPAISTSIFWRAAADPQDDLLGTLATARAAGDLPKPLR